MLIQVNYLQTNCTKYLSCSGLLEAVGKESARHRAAESDLKENELSSGLHHSVAVLAAAAASPLLAGGGGRYS